MERIELEIIALDPTTADTYDAIYKRRVLTPEESLLLAVLGNAVADLRRKGRRKEAKTWIQADEDYGVFTFVTICNHFNINPGYLRKRLLKIRRAK